MPTGKYKSFTLSQQGVILSTSRRFFCVNGANKSLPYVSRVVADIVDLHDDVVRIRRMMERIELGLHCEEDKDRLDAEYKAAMERLRFLVHELDAVGVDLQDFERGIITFPAMHDVREVALSWKLGESKISYWHEPTEGIDSRRPITTDKDHNAKA